MFFKINLIFRLISELYHIKMYFKILNYLKLIFKSCFSLIWVGLDVLKYEIFTPELSFQASRDGSQCWHSLKSSNRSELIGQDLIK